MPPGLLDFLKKNAKFLYGTGVLGAAFLAGDVKRVADADNKFKALLKTLWELVKIRVALAGMFTATAAGIRSLVRETGSLEAALKRLQQMQVAARGLGPLLGGVSAARGRVGELAALSARGPFDFSQILEANKALEIFTRGAYSSVQATQKIGEAAIASGNGIEDVARVVGSLYADLREGRPIEGASEQLRQMGIISQATKEHLDALTQSGGDVTAVFTELTNAMQTATGDYQNELAAVTAEHAKAVEELKIKFGASWTKDEVEITKNYSTAIRAITPVLAELSAQFAITYNGFHTFTSAMVKSIATSKYVQNIIQSLGEAWQVASVAAVVFGTAIALKVTPSLLGLVPALAASSSGLAVFAAWVIRIGALLSIWGLVATALVAVGVAAYNLYTTSDRLQKKVDEQNKSHRETIKILNEQAAAIKSLADKQEAYTKTVDERIASEKRLAELRKQLNKLEDDGAAQMPKWSPLYQKYATQLKMVENEEAHLQQVKKTGMAVAAASALGPKEEEYVKAQEHSLEVLRNENRSAQDRLRISRDSLEASKAAEQARGDLDTRIAQEKEYTEKSGKNTIELTRLEKERMQIGLRAPRTSAVYLEAKAEQLRQARDAKTLQETYKAALQGGKAADVADAVQKLERAKELSGGVTFDARELARVEQQAAEARQAEAEYPARERAAREARIGRIGFETETAAISARAAGDIRRAFKLEDLQRFISTFQALKETYGPEQAAKMAGERTQAEIKEQYAQAGNVVGYLQSIGGGGGLPQAGVDLQRRLLDVAIEQKEYLKQIAGGDKPAESQGLPAFFFNP